MVRAVLKGHTFNADPLLINTINLGTHAFNGNLQRSSMSGPFRRKLLIRKSKKMMRWASTPMKDSTSCGVISMGTSFPFKASKKALRCL